MPTISVPLCCAVDFFIDKNKSQNGFELVCEKKTSGGPRRQNKNKYSNGTVQIVFHPMDPTPPHISPVGFIHTIKREREENARLREQLKKSRNDRWNLSNELEYCPMNFVRFFCIDCNV